MEQFMLYFVMISICLIFMGVTILLGRKKVRRAFLKYIPSLLAALVTIAMFIPAINEEGFAALGYAIMTVLAGIVFLVSIVTAVIVEIVNRAGRHSESH